MLHKTVLTTLGTLALLSFTGCGSNSSSSNTANTDTKTGSVKVLLTDDPALYEAVYVTVDEVQVHKQVSCDTVVEQNSSQSSSDSNATDECLDNSPWQTIASPHRTINLLALQNGMTTELGEANISVGTYTQLRFILGEDEDNTTNILGTPHPYANYLILTGDDTVALKVPSNVLRQNHQFEVQESSTYEMLIDFDANQSIHQAGESGQWILTPVLGISGKYQNNNAQSSSASNVSSQQTVSSQSSNDTSVSSSSVVSSSSSVSSSSVSSQNTLSSSSEASAQASTSSSTSSSSSSSSSL